MRAKRVLLVNTGTTRECAKHGRDEILDPPVPSDDNGTRHGIRQAHHMNLVIAAYEKVKRHPNHNALY